MRFFSRNFISQKFGRSTGTVQMIDADTGTVVISTDDAKTGPYQFAFNLNKFTRSRQVQFSEENLLRTAIAQLHRNLHSHAAESLTILSSDVAPWIGDFSELPFGSATAPYQRRMTDEERRQVGGGLETSVEQGIVLLQSRGRPAARSFLQRACVPPSVIRRVLSNSASRRKACPGPP